MIDEETYEVGVGPVTLDVDMARRHGWTEDQIEQVWGLIEVVGRTWGELARQANPELYEYDEILETWVYTGIEGPLEPVAAKIRTKFPGGEVVWNAEPPPPPSLEEPCPHPARKGRHEIYVNFPEARKQGRKKSEKLPAVCHACGAKGEV